MRWSISMRPVRHMGTLSCILQKNNKSLQLTVALYYLPIILSITTKHNFIPFYVWSPDWKMLQNVACRTGHSSTGIAQTYGKIFGVIPKIVYFSIFSKHGWFQTKRFTWLLEFIKLCEQKPEKCIIFHC